MKNLKDKKILLFSPQFLGYDLVIKTELERLGAIVHMYDERPNPSSIEKICIRKAKFLMNKKIENYYSDISFQEKDFDADYIFFINMEAANRNCIRILKNVNMNAKFILYMWDSLKNKPIKALLNEFDKVYSFDKDDCINMGMKFRPLFYIPDFSISANKGDLEYDISFVGTVHSDRVKIICQLMDYCNQHSISYFWYLYVQGKMMFIFRWITDSYFRRIDKKYIHLTPMKTDEFVQIVEKSKCILDINHPKQTGLTMRTIEMVGKGKKILTTNENIKEYDFYNPTNQLYLDRNRINLDTKLFSGDYVPVSDELYQKYSLNGWIEEIFNF